VNSYRTDFRHLHQQILRFDGHPAVDPAETTDDLVRDMMELLTSMCGRR